MDQPGLAALALARGRGLDDIAAMFMIYGIVFATLSAIMAGLYSMPGASAGGGPDPGELALTAGDIGQFVWFILVGLASTLTAALSCAGWPSGLPGMPCLLAFTGLIHLLRARRCCAGLPPLPPPAPTRRLPAHAGITAGGYHGLPAANG